MLLRKAAAHIGSDVGICKRSFVLGEFFEHPFDFIAYGMSIYGKDVAQIHSRTHGEAIYQSVVLVGDFVHLAAVEPCIAARLAIEAVDVLI